MIVARRGGDVPAAQHGGRNALEHSRCVRHDFSVCLNAFGPADVVRKAIRSALVDEYPDPRSILACAAAADGWSVPIESLMLGAGSAELIDIACRAFVAPGDVVAIDTPAFGEYERAARVYGARVLHEVDDKARVVFVCSPSNPLGVVRASSELREIADRCAQRGALLVIDQAYDAFTESPVGSPLLSDHPAVLHLRSITKEHAIAGVRVAFAIAPAKVIESLTAVRAPWAASTLAQAAAIAAFTPEARSHVARTTAELRREAIRLRASLARRGYESSDSKAHFFMIRVRAAAAARQLLLDRAEILVRDCTSFGLPDRVRVAARRQVANDELLAALDDLAPALLP